MSLRTLHSTDSRPLLQLSVRHRCPRLIHTLARPRTVCQAAASMTPKLKLHYFELPARAETARILFTVGKVPYEEAYVKPDTWGTLKQDMPFGQVPVLEVDGVKIGQSNAINVYAAKLAGLYPEDPLEAAKAESASAQMRDAWDLVAATMAIKDQEEKLKARAELLEGKLHDKLTALDKYVAASGGDYVLGSKLTWADIDIYSGLSNLQGGFIDGIPKDITKRYPALKKLRNAVASHPAIAARYADATNPNRVCYKPDAEL